MAAADTAVSMVQEVEITGTAVAEEEEAAEAAAAAAAEGTIAVVEAATVATLIQVEATAVRGHLVSGKVSTILEQVVGLAAARICMEAVAAVWAAAVIWVATRSAAHRLQVAVPAAEEAQGARIQQRLFSS